MSTAMHSFRALFQGIFDYVQRCRKNADNTSRTLEMCADLVVSGWIRDQHPLGAGRHDRGGKLAHLTRASRSSNRLRSATG